MMRRIEIVPGDLTKGTSDERLEQIDGWGQSSYCELGEERRKKSVRRDVKEVEANACPTSSWHSQPTLNFHLVAGICIVWYAQSYITWTVKTGCSAEYYAVNSPTGILFNSILSIYMATNISLCHTRAFIKWSISLQPNPY